MDWNELSQTISELIDEGELHQAWETLKKLEGHFEAEPEFHLLKGDVLWARGDLREGLATYEQARALAPDRLDSSASVALAYFELLEFQRAREIAHRALESANRWEGERAHLLDLLSRLAERDGDYEETERLTSLAVAADHEAYPPPFRMTDAEFQEVANSAVEALPAEFLRALRENLAIVIEPVPPREILETSDPPFSPTILGLYTGVPLPEREASTSPPSLPDVIHLFQRNIEREASNREEVAEQIVTTVYHEIGHYFGMEEEELEELDLG